MALGTQVIDFIRLDLLDDPDQIGGIGQIAVVHKKAHILFVWIVVKVVHPGGVERRGPALDTVDFVALIQ